MNNNSNLRDSSDLTPKEEGTNNCGKKINPNKPTYTTTTSSWTKLKDPRIIRVSRSFGGKDRHSKVCTVRGLRDRRVRLSVPTAIQLYDLQDRLGLNQPSKAVDWLLDVAKNEIDELPPLQMAPGNFAQSFQSMISTAASQSQNIEEAEKSITNGINWDNYWNAIKSKEKEQHSLAQSNMLNNVDQPNGSFLKLNPSNLSLSQFGSYESMALDNTSHHNFNINFPGSQFLVYPPPSHDDHNSRHQFEMLSSTSSTSSSHNPLSSSPLYSINQGMMIRPFHLNMNPKVPFPPEENEED